MSRITDAQDLAARIADHLIRTAEETDKLCDLNAGALDALKTAIAERDELRGRLEQDARTLTVARRRHEIHVRRAQRYHDGLVWARNNLESLRERYAYPGGPRRDSLDALILGIDEALGNGEGEAPEAAHAPEAEGVAP